MSIQIVPSRYLAFQGPLDDKLTSSINLINRSDARFAFKIMTNAPKGLSHSSHLKTDQLARRK
jgi:hypothetical protein